jgi:hypothetical protein
MSGCSAADYRTAGQALSFVYCTPASAGACTIKCAVLALPLGGVFQFTFYGAYGSCKLLFCATVAPFTSLFGQIGLASTVVAMATRFLWQAGPCFCVTRWHLSAAAHYSMGCDLQDMDSMAFSNISVA